MAVKIAHAAKDENRKYKNGISGDQTYAEVYITNWYNRPWNCVIRFKDAVAREKVAYAMERACNNNLIGYDQNQRNTLLSLARNVGYDPGLVKTPCETDCSALVSLACMYAGIPESALVFSGNSTTTHTMRARLNTTGRVDILTQSKFLSSDKYLLRGDILLNEKAHVAVAISDGIYGKSKKESSITNTTAGIPSLRIASDISSVQKWLNTNYNAGLVVDGVYGKKTKSALVVAWQKFVGLGLVPDGVFGAKSKSASQTCVLKRGSNGLGVTIWQALLVCKGYNPSGIDGVFGNGCALATKKFQEDNKLTCDGVVGKDTWSAAFG